MTMCHAPWKQNTLQRKMNKSRKKLFEQLAQQKKDTQFTTPILHPSEEPLGYAESRRSYSEYVMSIIDGRRARIHPSYASKSLSQFADQLNRPIDILIEQFANAGIPGLTPQHVITDAHKEALLKYLRRSYGTVKTETIYESPASISSDGILIVQSINEELFSMLAKQPNLLYKLPPRSFEEIIARLLEKQGCEVSLTKRTRDGGYDILGKMKAPFADLIFLAECKRYKPENKVGVEIVRGLYGVTEAHRANLGLIITTSSFTADAREEKLRIGNRIELREYDDLCNWLTPFKI